MCMHGVLVENTFVNETKLNGAFTKIEPSLSIQNNLSKKTFHISNLKICSILKLFCIKEQICIKRLSIFIFHLKLSIQNFSKWRTIFRVYVYRRSLKRIFLHFIMHFKTLFLITLIFSCKLIKFGSFYLFNYLTLI